jgi:hypothetical protein
MVTRSGINLMLRRRSLLQQSRRAFTQAFRTKKPRTICPWLHYRSNRGALRAFPHTRNNPLQIRFSLLAFCLQASIGA